MSEQDFAPDETGFLDDQLGFDRGADLPSPPRPINWNLLSSADLEAELLELNAWVDWLRHTYGLPASVIPPMWHRLPGAVGAVALHLHWLGAYDPEQNASALLGVAPGLRLMPRPAPGMGSHQRHPARPRPAHPPDQLARRETQPTPSKK